MLYNGRDLQHCLMFLLNNLHDMDKTKVYLVLHTNWQLLMNKNLGLTSPQRARLFWTIWSSSQSMAMLSFDTRMCSLMSIIQWLLEFFSVISHYIPLLHTLIVELTREGSCAQRTCHIYVYKRLKCLDENSHHDQRK